MKSRFDTSAGNPVKEILLKLNLPDHRILKDGHGEELYFFGTEYQLADLFTKALPKERFKYLVHRICMRSMTPTQLESVTKSSS
ncbi:hypothetical protein Tco_1007555 [Tanacetum coccineum]